MSPPVPAQHPLSSLSIFVSDHCSARNSFAKQQRKIRYVLDEDENTAPIALFSSFSLCLRCVCSFERLLSLLSVDWLEIMAKFIATECIRNEKKLINNNAIAWDQCSSLGRRRRACAFARNVRLLSAHDSQMCRILCKCAWPRPENNFKLRTKKKKLYVRAPQPQNLKVEIAFLSPKMGERSLPAIFLFVQCQRCDCCVNIAVSSRHQEFSVFFLRNCVLFWTCFALENLLARTN